MVTRRWAAGLALAVAMVLGLSACGGEEQASSGQPDGAAQGSAPSASASGSPSPGQGSDQTALADVPKVVAEVNGEQIRRDEFALAYQSSLRQARSSGQKVDEQKLQRQVAKNLVYSELLDQEAAERGFTASKKEVRSTLEDLARQFRAGSVKQLFGALEARGLDRQQVLEDVRTQVRVDKLLADETGPVNPSEKELRQLYDKAVALQQQSQQGSTQDPPSFKQARPQLVQIFQQRQRDRAARQLVQQLRKKADVTIYL